MHTYMYKYIIITYDLMLPDPCVRTLASPFVSLLFTFHGDAVMYVMLPVQVVMRVITGVMGVQLAKFFLLFCRELVCQSQFY
jgi:hypothetical protein